MGPEQESLPGILKEHETLNPIFFKVESLNPFDPRIPKTPKTLNQRKPPHVEIGAGALHLRSFKVPLRDPSPNGFGFRGFRGFGV